MLFYYYIQSWCELLGYGGILLNNLLFFKYFAKFDKKKIKCFKCGKYDHFANECKVKQKINQLQINDKEKEELYNLLELRNTDSENEISPDEEILSLIYIYIYIYCFKTIEENSLLLNEVLKIFKILRY